MKSSDLDGVLRPPSRLAVLLWFTCQWFLIPVELVVRLVWNLVMFFGDGVNGADMRAPLARFVSPAKLSLFMSRNPARWEGHVDVLFSRLVGALRSERAPLSTSLRHPQAYVTRCFAGEQRRVRALTVDFREFRGAHYHNVQAALLRHGLEAKQCMADNPTQGLWVYLADDRGTAVAGSRAAK